MSHEEVELKSPFPVIPPLKDSKWNDFPRSPDSESQPVEPPKLYPDIGEEHPCPYFIGPDLNFVQTTKRKKKPAVVPTPVFPPPVILPSSSLTKTEEDEVLEACLEECLHGVVWECVAEQGRDMTREMFCAAISRNPERYTLDRDTLNVLSRKIFKKTNSSNWTEPCDQPIDSYKYDVLSCQAYKLSKARYTVTNEAMSDFHRKTVSQTTSNNLMSLFSSDMEKKLRKQDPKDVKQQPPRVAS